MDSLHVATLTYIRKKTTFSAIQRVDLSWGGGYVTSPQRGVCRCVYCCDGVEGGEEEAFGEGLLAKREEEEESERCSSSSFFKYSSLRANNSL